MQCRSSASTAGVAFRAATRAISGSIAMRAFMISIGLVRRAIEATSEALSIGRLPTKVPLPTWRHSNPSPCSVVSARRSEARVRPSLFGEFPLGRQASVIPQRGAGQEVAQATQCLGIQ